MFLVLIASRIVLSLSVKSFKVLPSHTSNRAQPLIGRESRLRSIIFGSAVSGKHNLHAKRDENAHNYAQIVSSDEPSQFCGEKLYNMVEYYCVYVKGTSVYEADDSDYDFISRNAKAKRENGDFQNSQGNFQETVKKIETQFLFFSDTSQHRFNIFIFKKKK